MGSISNIPVPPGNDLPPIPAFVPDRLGVRRVLIDVDRETSGYQTSLIPCPANATSWGRQDFPEITSPDLVRELLTAPDSTEKIAALQAVQRVAADLVTISGFILKIRE